jgi:DNA-binding beta-propeller fold protein YncE
MRNKLIIRLAAAGLALAFAACDLLDDGGSKSATWVGKPLDSLVSAGALAFHDGVLYVANGDKSQPGVAAVDTASGLITAYYRTSIAPAGLAFTDSGKLVVTETDYANGAISVIDPATKTIRKEVLPFGTDPGIASADGKVFLFDHTSGAVTGFTGNTPGANVALDVQAGAGSNPYAIAITGGKAYVARYNLASLLILNDASAIGGGTRDSIDLSAYVSKTPIDTPATAPRMSAVTAYGGYLFVTLQRLNYQYSALDTSLVVVIDAATKAIEKTIPLTYRNPVSAEVRDGVWYIAGVQAYGLQDGGVEKIDLATRTHGGTVTTEASLGDDISSYLPTSATGGYAVYSAGWPKYKVKKVSP